MRRIALIVPSETYRAADFTAAATRLGADLVVVSDRRPALAREIGDRSLVVDLDDVEGSASKIADLSDRLPLDAVVGVDDRGVLVAALAAQRLGLRHSAPDSVALTRDKAAMRDAFDGHGLRQPAWRLLERGDDPGAAAGQVGFPCVVKPLSLSASRGVIRVDDPGELGAAVTRVRHILDCAGVERSESLLIERFVSGTEVALEGFVRAGRLKVLALFDKPHPLDGPYFEETLYVTPSRLSSGVQAEVIRAAQEAVGALGLTEGPVHAEVRINDEGVWLLEVAARSIGGLCSRALQFGLGISLEEIILRHALGHEPHQLQPAFEAAGVMMLPISSGGVLAGVGGQDEARAVPGVAGLTITIPPGQKVVPLPEGDRYLGFLFARGDDPASVEGSLRTAHARLRINIEPGTAVAS